MASIFTYDPDPPRVSSPWLSPEDVIVSSSSPLGSKGRWRVNGGHSSVETPPPELLTDYNVTKLEPEPQTTSTEYKLHLLLRPRRTYSSSSTGTHISGSQQFKQPSSHSSHPQASAPIPAPSNQSRQNRLHQLTTQLLWRLQQSSPYHASSASDLVLPQLPDTSPNLDAPLRPGKLLPGLAESRGALYEIGVSDDGTFVGLTEDEMEESLTTLRAMAASLGCNVEVTRLVLVGDCKWQEKEEVNGTIRDMDGHPEMVFQRQAQLWVAEALVTPHLKSASGLVADAPVAKIPVLTGLEPIDGEKHSRPVPLAHSSTEQLRVTLTGPTTSGKSSLLGTLSTATLDNGRGKSRLSLLKHRHELETGLTSSVAQELIGYIPSSEPGKAVNVINYAAGNVTSWTDIHASSQGGRLVLVSDSAGHPRYRRTTVRGLVGWAPHWTILCIAADDGENAPSGAGGTSSAREILGVAGAGVDLAKAHLELCLKLDKPLAIIITKLDLASKLSLRQTLAKILTAVKGAGRVPSMLPPDQTKNITNTDLGMLSEADQSVVMKALEKLNSSDPRTIVPIMMTSAAKGTGIRALHALLHNLPIPPTPTSFEYVGAALNPEQPSCLFHIEDIFGMPAAYSTATSTTDSGVVVGGHLRFGTISVGDNIVLGPFPADNNENFGIDRNETRTPPAKNGVRSSPGSEYGSFARSHPSAPELTRAASRNAVSASVTVGEWHNAHIVSIRNLRLPVHRLEAGQVGTVGFVFDIPQEEASNGPFDRQRSQVPRIRKGMVLAIPSHHMVQTGHSLQAASGFTASFEDGDINSVTPGSLVVIYIASIRASARVIRLAPYIPLNDGEQVESEETDDLFGLEDTMENEMESDSPVFGTDRVTDVTLELMNNREWIELGSQVLIMPGGGHGLYSGTERGEKGVAGLEGFVGKITDVVD